MLKKKWVVIDCDRDLSSSLILLSALVALELIEQAQDLDEQIHNVHVQVDHTDDVLLGAQVLHDQLRVIDDVDREDERAESRQHGISEVVASEYL